MLRVGTHSLRPVQKATPTFTQKRFRRYAPGMVIPEGKVTRQTGVRDLLVTSVYSVQRPWRWIKSYRRRLLGELQYVVNPSLFVFVLVDDIVISNGTSG